ncbi:MAG: hypothetical protein ACOVQX_04465 [Legionella sp.]
MITRDYDSSFFRSVQPEQLVAEVKQYIASINVSSIADTSLNAFDLYLKNRETVLQKNFGNVLVDKMSVIDKLRLSQDRQAQQVIGSALQEALKISTTTSEASKTFHTNLEKLNTHIKNESAGCHPGNIAYFITEEKNAAHQAIKAQHDSEKGKFETLLNNPDFSTNLAKILDIDMEDPRNRSVLNQAKAELLDNLKKAQTEMLESFDKALDESIKNNHREAQKERDRITLLATIYHHNKKMRNKIDELYAQNIHAGINQDATIISDRFKKIKLEAFPKLLTETGRELITNPDGSMSLQIKIGFFSGIESTDSKLKNDLMSLALAFKSKGKEEVTLKVDHADEKIATKLACELYNACLAVGYDESKIKINVKGKEKKIEEIFSDSNTLLGLGRENAKAYAEYRNQAMKHENNLFHQQTFRKELLQLRRDNPGQDPLLPAPIAQDQNGQGLQL